jgi:hypothetical protein
MLLYKNPVLLEFNGVTLSFPGPELDPANPRSHAKDKEGDFSEYFLWKEGDPPATHHIADINVSGWLIQIRTESGNDWWHYVIYCGGACQFQFERKRKGGQWEPCVPVSLLHIKLNGEADEPTINSDGVSTFGTKAIFGHRGSTCTVTYNPATRQYVRRCT